ncbi:hypothetical protein Hdeb2414_s0004g00132141 [Helianthus debilis subsp. tardiflorus]
MCIVYSKMKFLNIYGVQIAEKVAAAGFYVVVPDFFYGDAYLPDMEISSWFLNHLPAKECEDARKVVC